MEVYMRLPIASLYGTHFMCVASLGFEGAAFLLYATLGVIGVLMDLASVRLKQLIMDSM